MAENKSARLCHIVKREDFDGYGFNLHAEKGKPGQYIGKVDDNSPAEIAGLKQGDRIIEVNSVNIGNESHKQVVQRIKAIANEVQLLVVDPALVSVSNNNQMVINTTTNNGTAPEDLNDSPNGRNGPLMNKTNDSHSFNATNTTSPVTASAGNYNMVGSFYQGNTYIKFTYSNYKRCQ